MTTTAVRIPDLAATVLVLTLAGILGVLALAAIFYFGSINKAHGPSPTPPDSYQARPISGVHIRP